MKEEGSGVEWRGGDGSGGERGQGRGRGWRGGGGSGAEGEGVGRMAKRDEMGRGDGGGVVGWDQVGQGELVMDSDGCSAVGKLGCG